MDLPGNAESYHSNSAENTLARTDAIGMKFTEV